MCHLITGGAGYIGTHAIKLLLKQGLPVVIFDNFSRGFHEPLELLKKYGDIEVVEGDLKNRKDIDGLFNQFKIDSVFHFAAYCIPNESMEDPGMYFENNTFGSLNLLEAMKTAGVKKIIFSSTCATYGNAQYIPVDERHPQVPENPYGESKLLTERMLRWYGKQYDVQYIILRYFNVCGADSDGEIGDHDSISLMQSAVRGALGIRPFGYTCPKVDTPDGTPIRDYIDVEDLVAAHYAALKYLEEGGVSDVFNLGNGKGFSVKEIVDMVEDVCDVTIEKADVPVRKGDPDKVLADPTKAFKVLNWKPKKSLEESIISLKKWYEHKSHGYSH